MAVRVAPVGLSSSPSEYAWLVRRARALAWAGIGWHAVEAATAVAAGVAASSIALVGFGIDSIVESLAGFALLWRFGVRRAHSPRAERTAQRLIAASFWLLAAYVGLEGIRMLAAGTEPDASWVGIGLAAVTALTMPLLAVAKRRTGRRLASSATVSEGAQNLVCAYLSVALLVGLTANAVLGWWWADPLAALLIAGLAVREGIQAWRGDPCCQAC
jgi:divalent metal cation (Fe/Co/Zn/Cd) transporter